MSLGIKVAEGMRLQGVCLDLVKNRAALSPAAAQSEGLLQRWAPTRESSGPVGLLGAHSKQVTFRSRAQTQEKCINLTLSIWQTLFNYMS